MPAASWIGGSVPYFMTEEGGLTTRHKIYVTELAAAVSDVSSMLKEQLRNFGQV